MYFGQFIFIILLGVLRRFQHYTGHITTGSFVGRGNQYIWNYFILIHIIACDSFDDVIRLLDDVYDLNN